MRYTKQLTDQIERTKGKPLNIAAWINFYTFDIVGDLAFGTSFNYLRTGVKDKFLTESHESQVLMGFFRQFTWLFMVFKETPLLNNSWLSFQSWLKERVEIRRKVRVVLRWKGWANSPRINLQNRMYFRGFWRTTSQLRTLQRMTT